MSYIQIAQKLPEENRFLFIELLDAFERDIREKLAVRREDFDELKEVVSRLERAQERSEHRLDRLEAVVLELAEAQKRTEQRLDRLGAVVEELAEAQKRTEQRVEELAEAQKNTQDSLTRFQKDQHAQISALGARWGWQTEETFRNAILGILTEFVGLRVERYLAFDPAGEVFGRPDQVELDLIIRDGETLVGEIKSSASKGDAYIFERKVAFYEKREGVRVEHKILITPMLDRRAQSVVDTLGIQVYSSAYDFGETFSSEESV